MEEIWKDIIGFEGLYQVSNFGRIKSLPKKYFPNGCILKLTKSNKNYLIAILKKNNIQKAISVHRLVAQAFIPNPNNWPQVNHIDGNKANNCVNNLEWCTNSYNRHHASINHLLFTRHINQYDLKGNFIKKWFSVKEASEFYKINSNSLRSACGGKKGIYKGFIWRYADK